MDINIIEVSKDIDLRIPSTPIDNSTLVGLKTDNIYVLSKVFNLSKYIRNIFIILKNNNKYFFI